jgi:hypothetical protein
MSKDWGTVLIGLRPVLTAKLVAGVTLLLGLFPGGPALADVAQDRDALAPAGQPHAYLIEGSEYAGVTHRDFMWHTEGRHIAAVRANGYVHDDMGSCSITLNMCTVQIFNNDRYRVYHFDGCALFGLDNFTGLFETNNWQLVAARFFDVRGTFIGRYWSGRADPVEWSPVEYIRTCAE